MYDFYTDTGGMAIVSHLLLKQNAVVHVQIELSRPHTCRFLHFLHKHDDKCERFALKLIQNQKFI